MSNPEVKVGDRIRLLADLVGLEEHVSVGSVLVVGGEAPTYCNAPRVFDGYFEGEPWPVDRELDSYEIVVDDTPPLDAAIQDRLMALVQAGDLDAIGVVAHSISKAKGFYDLPPSLALQ